MGVVYRTGEKIDGATMRDRVERLRIWMVVGTVLLVMALAGFLGYQHYRAKAFLAGLPGRLGAEITRETNGYTYSQTVEGRTIFTLHAAKMEQRKDGVVRLHNVGVVLYGRRQNRADRIYGDEFEYDQEKGVVRALGVVHMDLQAPAPVDAGGKKQRTVSATGGELAGELAGQDPRVIHVMTSGLVYLTNLGVGATKEQIEFSEGFLKGTARGADYSSDTGVITLQSEVRVNGLAGGGPMTMTASRAELNQTQQTTRLSGAKVVTASDTVEAVDALVHVRKDGSPERIEGAGGVRITRDAGGTVMASQADASLNPAGKATALRLWGSVRYLGEDVGRKTRAAATEARVSFDAAGRPTHVTAAGDASVDERESRSDGLSSRFLTARTVEVALTPSGTGGKSEVHDAEALGAARLVVVNEAPAGPNRTEMTADDLKARFVGGRQVSNVFGTGHTTLRQVDAAGVDETSAGDTTELVFMATGHPATVQASGLADPDRRTTKTGQALAPVQSHAGIETKRVFGQNNLACALQTGHVSMERKVVARPGSKGSATEQKATAERAVYDGGTDRVTLTGGVVMSDAESTIWAAKVVADRGTGDATAEGGVRVSYAQAAEGEPAGGREREPVHVLASRAQMFGATSGDGSPGRRGAQRAFFYGVPGKMARMWQGTSQVEAPVIEMEEGARSLTASGASDAMQVHTTMLSTGQGRPRTSGPRTAQARDAGANVVRVLSGDLVYTDATREAVFTGGVVVDDADGRMKSQRATVYLQPAKQGPVSSKAGVGTRELLSGGNVDRVVAVGRVELDQPGRRGTGERLVYTAADGNFVLTGTAAAPPQVTDETKGTVTGGALRFHSGDDSVVVVSEGIQSAGTGNKRRTETRVKQ